MKFIPLLSTTQLVPSLLDGSKIITRRLRGLDVINASPDDWMFVDFIHGSHKDKSDTVARFVNKQATPINISCPYGQPGDVLWVRETWTQNGLEYYRYKADWTKGGGTFTGPSVPAKFRNKWKPNIHMPKTACRIFLQIKSIRVERLWDISEEEALLEGCQPAIRNGNTPVTINESSMFFKLSPTKYRLGYEKLWSEINGPENYDLNPWVWVIKFRRIEKPEGFLSTEASAQVDLPSGEGVSEPVGKQGVSSTISNPNSAILTLIAPGTAKKFLQHAVAVTRKRAAPRHLESTLQQQCVRWFDHQYALRYTYFIQVNVSTKAKPKYKNVRVSNLMMLANAGNRTRAGGSRAIAEGLSTGASDLILAAPTKYITVGGTSYHGLCFEMKIGKNTQSEAQKKFQQIVTQQGYFYVVIRTFDQFKSITENYLGK